MGTRALRSSPAAFVVTLLLALAALTLAACGGSGTTASSSPSVGPSQAAASPSPSLSPTMSPIAVPVVKPGEKPPPFAELAKMYAYDASTPLNVRDQEFAQLVGTDAHTARGIVYAGAGREVNAYLFAPKGKGPFPAVLVQSGYPYVVEAGVPLLSVEDAASLTDQGYVCLFVDYPTSRDLTDYHTGKAVPDVREYVRTVIDLRRGIDVLATLPEVDSTRIGFMGEDTAASMGAILAGVDPRIRAYALALTGGYLSTLVAWDTRPGGEHYLMGDALTKGALSRYEAQMSVVDPVHYIGHNKGASFLIADMKHEWPAEWRMKEVSDLVAATPKATTLRWYDNGQGYSGMTLYGVEDDMQRMLDAWMQKTL
jgi:hypothetical protein